MDLSALGYDQNFFIPPFDYRSSFEADLILIPSSVQVCL